MNYTIYNTTTGQIFNSGYAPELNIQIVPDGFTLISQQSNPSTDYVVDGQVVELPSKPNEYCIFDYTTKQWVDSRTSDTQWPIVRAERNQRLQATDWTQLADIPQETKALWEPYRQALRDVTSQPDPFNIVWPTPPTA